VKLRQLEVFRAIYLAGSITGAAKKLHITSPAISRMLGHLEQQLNYLLFLRTSTGLAPTFEAQQLFRATKPLFAQLDQVQALSESLKLGAARRLRLASSSSASLKFVPTAIAILATENPALDISLDVLQADDIVDQLLSFDIDAGVSTIKIEHPDIFVEPLFETRLVCAFKKGHELGKSTSISINQVSEFELINFHSKAPQVAEINRLVTENSETLVRTITARFSSAALSLVAATNCVALIDEVAARDFRHPELDYRPINDYQTFQISLVSLRQNPNINLINLFRHSLERALTKT
jgi:DNA-binding transcriptional LysR family regulator